MGEDVSSEHSHSPNTKALDKMNFDKHLKHPPSKFEDNVKAASNSPSNS